MRGRTGPALAAGSTDDARFSDLYERCVRAIRDYARRRVANDSVDDVVAETFLAAWRNLHAVPAGDEALLWLYQVAYRAIGHQWRATARRRRLDTRLRGIAEDVPGPADESLLAGEECRLVLGAAARLGDGDAELLRLVTWERLSTDEAAAVLGIAPNAVRQRLFRARQRLAREYRRLEAQQAAMPDASPGGAR